MTSIRVNAGKGSLCYSRTKLHIYRLLIDFAFAILVLNHLNVPENLNDNILFTKTLNHSDDTRTLRTWWYTLIMMINKVIEIK